jgi:peptide/nickel transport system substrate-binding protein
MEKKNIAITVLLIALIASGIGNIVLVMVSPPGPGPESTEYAYIRATSAGPNTLELVDSWDSASNDVLEQVVETLFFYDLFDLNLPMINVLAESYHWVDSTTLQIKLKEGIKFHDGTDFDAAAAKWNLDRLQYLINATGTNTGQIAHTRSLWMFPDGVTPIMDTITTVGDYNITITLNGAYAPFLSTLTYINAGMISPTAHAGDETTFIDLTTGDVVGTGPFTYDKFVPDVEVRFSRWEGYWQAPANFPLVIYAIYSDATTAHNAMIAGDLDANAMASDQNIAVYDTMPEITVERFTEETGKPSLVYQYLGFNNHKYNRTWREAFSYAINYTYVIDELRLGNAFRATGAISPGFGAAYNASVPAFAPPNNSDIAHARTVMQSMGYGVGFTTDSDWTTAAASTPFATVTYTYNTGNTFREDLGVAVTDWFEQIGVAVNDDGVTWDQFLNYLFDDYDHLGVFAIGWAPDYLDPYNMLDPLFNPASWSNSGQVNDTKLNTMMAAALAETDTNLRNDIYKNIQSYMARQLYAHAPLYHSKVLSVRRANIHNVPTNAMGALRIYPMYRGLYP